MNADLRGLVDGLREAIKDWGDNLPNVAMVDLLGHADRITEALSVAQGQGFVMVPRGNIEALIRDLESPVGCYTGAIAKELRYLLAAAPAQPDGVRK